MPAIERDLIIDKRVYKQLADSAIKKDPIRALVELITNSDDSYRTLEAEGRSTTGRIVIEINRKRIGSIIKVIDQAMGFDDKTMDARVGTFGAATSGLMAGLDVRGFYGRGLKESIICLGRGQVVSIKDNVLYECSLDEKAKYRREEPRAISKRLRRSLSEEYGFDGNGTVVAITVTNRGISVPFFDTVVGQVSKYFSLRDINSSQKRSVYIIERNNRGQQKQAEKIDYRYPLGKEVFNKTNIEVIGYPGALCNLRVSKTNDILSQDGPCRDGGLLVKGKTAIHDITLFGYEEEFYAHKLFGVVQCEFIDELVKKDEPVLSDRRDGLDWHYPFCIALKDLIKNELRGVIDNIRSEEEQQRKSIENERTRQRFHSALEKINEIAREELSTGGEGDIKDPDGESANRPPNGFDFIPEYYHIVASKRSSLSLKVVVPWIIPVGSVITIESDNEDVSVEQKVIEVKDGDVKDNLAIYNPKVYGRRVGSEAVITARVQDGPKAEALIKVVSMINRKKPEKEREGNKQQGLFSGIGYDSSLGPTVRYYFDRTTKIIQISSKHPCVEAYLGPGGDGQEQPPCQVLVAELVTDAVCREVARRKAEAGKLHVLGEEMDAINREHNRLINSYAHIIHKFLVSPEARRR